MLQDSGMLRNGSAPTDTSRFISPFTLQDGRTVPFEVPFPAFLTPFSTSEFGYALFDKSGFPLQKWGIAEKMPVISSGNGVLDGELFLFAQSALNGNATHVLFEGNRLYFSPIEFNGELHLQMFAVSAREEQAQRHANERIQLTGTLLRRLGKVLTMNQSLIPLCTSIVHELNSTLELAAAIIWVCESDEDFPHLAAHVGVNRQGVSALQHLNLSEESTCMAELVGVSRRSCLVRNVAENLMTAQLEAKFCYLKPGMLYAMPLFIGDRLLGVIEMIARDSSNVFVDQKELFETAAEHIALALNSTIVFENLEQLAMKDPLTGIANHRSMQEFLNRRIQESLRTSAELGLIMIDVDHFRTFNEEEGHDVGDMVLKRVVNVIKQAIRPYDLAARYGGEEFTVVMPGSNKDSTYAIAERIRQRIELLEIPTSKGGIRHVTASLGCAIFPATSTDPGGLLKAADLALYQAKRSGRNKTEIFEGRLNHHRPALNAEFDTVMSLLDPEDRHLAGCFRTKVEAILPTLRDRLVLSEPQFGIMISLIHLLPKYLISRESNPEQAEQLEKSTDLRNLAPILSTFDERFDGNGPRGLRGNKIPILTRIMQVLLAYATDGTTTFLQDPAKFDPEIVRLVIDSAQAA